MGKVQCFQLFSSEASKVIIVRNSVGGLLYVIRRIFADNKRNVVALVSISHNLSNAFFLRFIEIWDYVVKIKRKMFYVKA